MLNNHFGSTSHGTQHDDHEDEEMVREIHALTPPPPPQPPPRHGHRPSSMSLASTEGGASSENFTTMSREFNALVIAGSSIDHNNMTHMMVNYGHENEVVGGNNNNNYNNNNNNNSNSMVRIGEDDLMEETNPLAIVTDNHSFDPVPSSIRPSGSSGRGESSEEVVSVERVKKEEVDAKISAWQNAKIAKINNRFKREDAVINGWESEQIQKASSWMKKIERKLEEKRARAMEKMQNNVAKARRKAEEKRASAEAKRGTKVARVLEIANLMKAVGRPPSKKSFFKLV